MARRSWATAANMYTYANGVMMIKAFRKTERSERHGPMNSRTKREQPENRKLPRKDEKLPPNENLNKLPDEVYGDTKIPESHRK